MKKLLFSLLFLTGTLFAQDWLHSNGGYVAAGDSVTIVSPDFFEYNYITVFDTAGASNDSVSVYVADLFYGSFTQVKLKDVETWGDSTYATVDSTKVKKYLILHPFAESIKLVNPSSGSIRWSFEGR